MAHCDEIRGDCSRIEKLYEKIEDLRHGFCPQHGGIASVEHASPPEKCPRCLQEKVKRFEAWFNLFIDHIGPSDMSDDFEMRLANWCAAALEGKEAPKLSEGFDKFVQRLGATKVDDGGAANTEDSN